MQTLRRNSFVAVWAFSMTTAATGAAQLAVTEVWPGGLLGEESTSDWIEVTNLGATPFTGFDRVLLRTTEIPANAPTGIPVPGATFEGVASLAPGESAVFMTDYDADAYDPINQTFYNSADASEAIAAFRTIWGAAVDTVQVGFLEATFGGPGDGLDQNGESVFLYEGTPFETGAMVLIDEAGYPNSNRASWEFNDPASATGNLSVVGVNGAFEGVLPANAVPGVPPAEGLPPIGSPGVFVPEPSFALMFGLGVTGWGLMRRRASL